MNPSAAGCGAALAPGNIRGFAPPKVTCFAPAALAPYIFTRRA